MRNGCSCWLWGLWLLSGALTHGAELHLQANDRVLVLAPHPDDETIGCGGLIQQAVRLKLPVQIVWLTYGDNNEWSFLVYRKLPVLLPSGARRMGEVRHDEAVAAARVLGVPSGGLIFLGDPDFRTLSIWYAYWGQDRPPLRSMLTRTRVVPYGNAYREGAPYKGEAILEDLKSILRDFRPTKIFTAHPADRNGDHRALYLFTRVAMWDTYRDEPAPQLLPYLVHFGGWPVPRGEWPDRPLAPPRSLADQIAWRILPVSPAQIQRKREALQAHRTQYGYSRKYLSSFLRTNELFGDFPIVRLRLRGDTMFAERVDELPADEQQLSESEQRAFIGMDREYLRREPDALVLTVELSRPLANDVEASVYAFGYRPDRPFATMPKIHVRVGQFSHGAYDQARKLPRGQVTVDRTFRKLTLRVPWSVLGDPDRLLTSARTYLGEVPLDWLAWRVVELPAENDRVNP